MKKQTCKSIDHRCDVRSFYVTVPTSSNIIQTVFLYNSTASRLQAMVSMYLQTTASPEEELLQIHVRARTIMCPIFQYSVCLCEILSTHCQSSCIPKHSYMHNHASYMSIHSIRSSCYPYASAFSIPALIAIKINHVNFRFLLLTINVYCHVNFKVQQSCQHSCPIQAPAVMSIKFSSFSNTFVSVVGQAASLYPRTACTCQFVSVIGQVASSHPRTACTYPFDIRRATSSDPRTARAFYFLFPVSQVTSSNTRTACAFYFVFLQPSN